MLYTSVFYLLLIWIKDRRIYSWLWWVWCWCNHSQLFSWICCLTVFVSVYVFVWSGGDVTNLNDRLKHNCFPEYLVSDWQSTTWFVSISPFLTSPKQGISREKNMIFFQCSISNEFNSWTQLMAVECLPAWWFQSEVKLFFYESSLAVSNTAQCCIVSQ